MAGLKESEKLATRLMKKWGLTEEGWTFGWDYCKTSFGMTRYTKLQITLSKYLTSVSTIEEVKDTILHEIAHALSYEDNGHTGHGRNWKKWCLIVGASPNRLGPVILDKDRLKVKQLHFNYEEPRRYRMRK